jgi:putative ABC transport system permease protein
MRIGFRKILRDLWRSKGRTLLAVASIFIGVFAVGMVSGMSDLMPARMIDSYRETNPAHIFMAFAGTIDQDVVSRLERTPGVAAIEGGRGFGAQWRLNPSAPWRNATIVLRDDYADQKINTSQLVRGAWPSKHTLAAEELAVQVFGVPANGIVWMKVDDREREMKIAGVVQDLAINSPLFGGNATFYISRQMAEDVFGARGYDRLYAQVEAFTEPRAEAIAQDLKQQIEQGGPPVWFYRVDPPDKHPAQDMINGVNLILGVMAVLTLGLGLFLVINTINAIVAQQVPQIGMMKAIGGTTRQMLLLYLSSVLVYSLLALAVAVPLGALAASRLTATLLPLMPIPPDPAFRVSQSALTQQILIGLLVPLLAALWPVFSGVRITVREAISSYGISARYGKGLLDRLLARWRSLPRTMALTLRNTFRRKGRVALTQITLIMAGVVFVMVASSSESFNYTIDFLTNSLGLKVLVNFQRAVRSDEAKAIITAQPNVDQVEMQIFQVGSAFNNPDAERGEDIFVNAFRPDSRLLHLPIVTGRWLSTEDDHAVVLTKEVADKVGVKAGDKIYISLEGGKKTEWTIVGTVFDLSNMQRNVFVPLSTYQRENGLTGRATSAWISTAPDDVATQRRVEKEVRDILNERGLPVGGTQTQESIRANSNSQFSILTTMLLAMSALIAAVGAIGLGGTLSINVLERRREIGVMRAIGASTLTIAWLFIGEGLLLGLLAWLIAIPLSIPVGQVFATVIGQVINLTIIYQFSWNGALQWLIIIVVLSILGSALPARRATRVSVRESLAYE